MIIFCFRSPVRWTFFGSCLLLVVSLAKGADHLKQVQTAAIVEGRSPVAHWGWRNDVYAHWSTHSNRLIPVYTYGTFEAGPSIDLRDYQGANSAYRSAEKLTALYGQVPKNTLSPAAEYMDQTDLYRLQRAAAAAGRKHIFLVIFDGMDWHTTRAAAVHNLQAISYDDGRGQGTFFQEFTADGSSQFGWMVTTPFCKDAEFDVDTQTVTAAGKEPRGGYDSTRGGATPWDAPSEEEYLISGESPGPRHAFTDSASSATSMTTGIKTYNGAINVDPAGKQVPTIASQLQADGWSVGAISSVPVSHATVAAVYAHNVSRDDYQDLTCDLVGRPSVSHPVPLAGLDVLIAGGWGVVREKDEGQGENFVPGNAYITEVDLDAINVDRGGRYVVVERTAGVGGAVGLEQAARRASREGKRLFGMFGVAAEGHLPYATADGNCDPPPGKAQRAEQYSPADVAENPTLADLTRAALEVLGSRGKPFWLMIEAGDVDWACHDNNLDNMIGAINSGDQAVRAVAAWVEANSNWNESLMIVTADHGHYLVVDDPSGLVSSATKPLSATDAVPSGASRSPVAVP